MEGVRSGYAPEQRQREEVGCLLWFHSNREARYRAFDAASVERILMIHGTPRTAQQQLVDKARGRIRESMAHAPVRQRDLSVYGRLLGGPASSTSEAPAEDQHADDAGGTAGEDS